METKKDLKNYTIWFRNIKTNEIGYNCIKQGTNFTTEGALKDVNKLIKLTEKLGYITIKIEIW